MWNTEPDRDDCVGYPVSFSNETARTQHTHPRGGSDGGSGGGHRPKRYLADNPQSTRTCDRRQCRRRRLLRAQNLLHYASALHSKLMYAGGGCNGDGYMVMVSGTWRLIKVTPRKKIIYVISYDERIQFLTEQSY